MVRKENPVPGITADQNESAAPESGRNDDSTAARRLNEIAIRAYYHAERRGFGAEGQVEDWLRAEQEIDGADRSGGIAAEQSQRADGTATGPDVTPSIARNGSVEIEPDQVQRWAKTLGVSAPRLRKAIKRAGSKLDDVKRFLAREGRNDR